MPAVVPVFHEVGTGHDDLVSWLDRGAEDVDERARGADGHDDVGGRQRHGLLARQMAGDSLAYGRYAGVGAVAQAQWLHRVVRNGVERGGGRGGRRHVGVPEREVAHRVRAEGGLELKALLEHLPDEARLAGGVLEVSCDRLHRGSPHWNLTGSMCQMSLAYSITALSDENLPERAMLTRDIVFHFFASRYVASTLSCASL